MTASTGVVKHVACGGQDRQAPRRGPGAWYCVQYLLGLGVLGLAWERVPGTTRPVFYALSKRLDLVLSPLMWVLLLGALAALAVYRGRRRLGLVAALVSLSLLYGASTALCARPLWRFLETHDARSAPPNARYDAVLLLGGFALAGPTGDVEFTEGVDRLFRAFELYREGRAARIVILAGGDGRSVSEADMIARALVSLGVPRAHLLLDTRSRNTRQNAREAKRVVDSAKLSKLVLVTSAFHMQRAIECFHAVGLFPDAIATDHMTPHFATWFDAMAPRAANLALCERGLREWVGRWVYRVRGFSG